MKKQIALLLAAAMAVTGITGCSSDSGKAQTSIAADSGTEAGNAGAEGNDSKSQAEGDKKEEPKDVIVL